jgi:hypothetical protein
MYQAWKQDNPAYVADWYKFIERSSKQLGMSVGEIKSILDRCPWFKEGWDPLGPL